MGKEEWFTVSEVWAVLRWTSHTRPWEASIYGGKAGAGSGMVSLEHGSQLDCKKLIPRSSLVAAGICLLEEAGGLITTANPPEDIPNAKIEDAKLGGRLYLAIRPAGDGAEETGRQSQERTVREVWRRVAKLDYSRPGV